MFEIVSLKHPCIKKCQKFCRRTLFKYIASKFGLQHQHQRLAVVGRDCTRRCRQCLCPRAAGAARRADGRALCALSIPPSPAISHWDVLYYLLRTLPPRHKVSPGWKACAGLGLADAATQRQRQTGRAHCVTAADASGNHTPAPGFNIHAPHAGLCTEM